MRIVVSPYAPPGGLILVGEVDAAILRGTVGEKKLEVLTMRELGAELERIARRGGEETAGRHTRTFELGRELANMGSDDPMTSRSAFVLPGARR